jgi:hypothetical protein
MARAEAGQKKLAQHNKKDCAHLWRERILRARGRIFLRDAKCREENINGFKNNSPQSRSDLSMFSFYREDSTALDHPLSCIQALKYCLR